MRLKLGGAICIQPLIPAQVLDYVRNAGPSFSELTIALEREESLRELAQSPLMLDVMMLAFRNRPVDAHASATVDAWRQRVFAVYTERMFARGIARASSYSTDSVVRSLQWLAGEMLHHVQSIFLIEELQPSQGMAPGLALCLPQHAKRPEQVRNRAQAREPALGACRNSTLSSNTQYSATRTRTCCCTTAGASRWMPRCASKHHRWPPVARFPSATPRGAVQHPALSRPATRDTIAFSICKVPGHHSNCSDKPSPIGSVNPWPASMAQRSRNSRRECDD